MSFLLDTDICSAYLKNDPRVVGKVMLHFGGLQVSVVTIGELLTWALRANSPSHRLQVVRDFQKAVSIVDVDLAIAERFGEIRAALLDLGRPVGEMDIFNAACALVSNLTLVTHNVQDYANIPGLVLADWMVP